MIVRVGVRIALPRIPRLRRKRMRWRSDAEQIHRRKLAILVVPEFDETLRPPAVRQELAIAICHPEEVVPAVKQRRKIADFMVLMEILTASQCSGKQPDA